MTSKFIVASSLLLATGCLLPIVGFADEDLSATGSEVLTSAPRSLRLSSEDSEFLVKAVKVSAREVADADTTVHTAQRPAVKDAARSIASMHARTRTALDSLTRQKGIDVSDETMIVAATEARSDAALVAVLLQANEDAVASFNRESIRGQDPDVRRFARNALPALQRDLASLRTLQNSIPAAM